MKKIAIMVDSISTMGSNGNPTIDGVFTLPLGLTTPNKESVDDITSGISTEDILSAATKKEYYRTSSTKMKTFCNMVEKILKDYDLVIYLCISSELSSQFNNLQMQLALLGDDLFSADKLWIFDTNSAGYAIEEMVYEIKRQILVNENKITKQEIQAIIQKENEDSEEYIVCKNLLGVNQTGRIKYGLVKLIDWLNRIPVIRFDKNNKLQSLVKNYDKAVEKIIKKVKIRCEKENKKITKICAVYIPSNENNVRNYAKELAKTFKIEYDDVVFRNIMFPVLTHTLFDTFCFYFKYESK